MEQQLIEHELEKFLETIGTFPASEKESKFYNIESVVTPIEQNMFKQFFGEEEYRKAIHLILQAQEAIKKCKSDALEEGLLQFNEVRKKSEKLSDRTQQYVFLFYLSGVAYYYFRKKDFAKAIAYTLDEIKETESVENKGATSLHYRRTGHLINLIKIFKVSNQIENTIPLFVGALNYLLNGNNQRMPQGTWNSDSLNLIPYVRQRSFDIFFIEAVDMLISLKDDYGYKKRFVEELFMQVESFEPQNNNQVMIYNWLYLQKLFMNHDYANFVKDCSEFCQVSFDSSFDSLKLSLLANVVQITQEHLEKDTHLQKQLSTKINDFIISKLSVSEHLKENVCHLIYE